jgi:ubiquinone/menaquinone biosynthesis C-methylase UbiE
MGFYQDHIVPYLIHLAMRQRNLVPYRERVLANAQGRVLEVGIGSGFNLPFYPPHAQQVIGLDPSAKLLALARRGRRVETPIQFVEGSAEAVPLEANSVDTVVTTWTLCSIPDVHRALGEMRRVLRPGGSLLFVEHGLSPEPKIRKWQDRLTPAWRRVAGGCHLNRSIAQLIEGAGFQLDRLETGYMRGPKPMTFMYEGRACPR